MGKINFSDIFWKKSDKKEYKYNFVKITLEDSIIFENEGQIAEKIFFPDNLENAFISYAEIDKSSPKTYTFNPKTRELKFERPKTGKYWTINFNLNKISKDINKWYKEYKKYEGYSGLFRYQAMQKSQSEFLLNYWYSNDIVNGLNKQKVFPEIITKLRSRNKINEKPYNLLKEKYENLTPRLEKLTKYFGDVKNLVNEIKPHLKN